MSHNLNPIHLSMRLCGVSIITPTRVLKARSALHPRLETVRKKERAQIYIQMHRNTTAIHLKAPALSNLEQLQAYQKKIEA